MRMYNFWIKKIILKLLLIKKNNMDKEKENLKDAIKSLNKKYDGNSVMKISEMNNASIKTFSTNCFSLDNLFGCGGLPKGRIIEMFGEESSGKTSMALFLIAQVQKQGGEAVFIDAEHCFTKEYAEKIGVKIDELYVSQPDFGEEALDIIDKTARTGEVDIIVVDSVSSLIPKKEYEAEIEKENIALQARMMSKGLRKLTGILAKSETTVIFINQIRQKTGIFWGSPNITSGGKALKFYASVRIEVKKKKKIEKNDKVIGNHLLLCAVKNKIGYPWETCELDLIFERGIDLIGDLLDFAENEKVIQKVGNTYTFKEDKLGVGRDNTKKYLDEHSEVVEKIKKVLKV